jgi:hypothetical protein
MSLPALLGLCLIVVALGVESNHPFGWPAPALSVRTLLSSRFTWSSGVALGALLGIVILSNAFATYFIAKEQYVYFWDWSVYWIKYREISASLLQHPRSTLHVVMESVGHDDYNYLPVLPLAPFEWLFGSSRLTYILAITNFFLLPAAFVMGLAAQRILEPIPSKRSVPPLMLATASIVAFHSLWMPVLRGLPDVAGIVVIGGIILLHFAKPFAEHRLGNLVVTGLLLCLLVLLRRWYAFWVVAFFPALAIAHCTEVYRHGFAWRSHVTAARNVVIIGLTFIFALFAFATPFTLRVIQTDYSDIYSAFRTNSSLFEAAAQFPSHFGWVIILAGLLGLAWFIVRRETRRVGIFLAIQPLIIFVLFARIQDFGIQHYYLDFGIQHYYLLLPSIALGIAVVVIRLWTQITNGLLRTASIGLLFTGLLLTSSSVFSPGAANISRMLGNLVPKTRNYPLVRNDIDALNHLLDRLGELELEQPGLVYVLASSAILNSDIVQNHCLFGLQRRVFCDQLFWSHNVDKRDGFPRQFLRAAYVVIASPTQYHLRAEDQRVIGILAREVMEGHGVGASFRRLAGEFKLDKGVTVWVYAKVRPLERTDLHALQDEFAQYYPDKRDIFTLGDN